LPSRTFRECVLGIPAEFTLAGCGRAGCKTFVMPVQDNFVRVVA
jgi:hypothetical protein